MKQSILYALLGLIILAAVVQVQGESTVVVTDYSVTPSILMPGEKGMVTVTLSNTQSGSFDAGILQESSSEQAALVSSAPVIESVFLNGKKDISVLAGNGQFEGQVGAGQSIRISFVIEAPPSSGIYFAELLIRLRGKESIKYPIAVNVNTPISSVRQPAIIVSQSSSGPIRPGESFPVTISLTNRGASQAKDITVRVRETGLSIAPLYTGAFHIERLRQGDTASGELIFNTDKKVVSGIHKIPIDIVYTTPDKGETVISDTISLDIRGEADVSIMSLETNPARVMENTPFDLIIRLDNPGTGDAESVRADLRLPFQGAKEAFVGRIEPYNDAPAVFILQSGKAGEFPYELDIHYKDDWGEHQKSENLTLTVIQPEDGTVYYLLLVLLALIGYGGYRLWQRRGDV